MRIALHTPLNSGEDGGTSGDRRMVRQLRTVLERLGHVVEIVAHPRTYARAPDGPAFDSLRRQALAAASRLDAGWRQAGSASDDAAPALWLTYHNYHKAPDLLGPLMTERLCIPYVIVEASHAGSLLDGPSPNNPWAARAKAALDASLAADLHFCLTAQDGEGLLEGGVDPRRLTHLPPFIDTAGFARLPARSGPARQGPLRLVSVAMMRPGGKFASYGELALALGLLVQTRPDLDWTLTLAGDGEARSAVENLFRLLEPGRVRFTGLVPADAMPTLLADHDLFVWPGLHEPFGLVYLEAQAAGLPIAAYDSGGVADTVIVGKTALLVKEGDVAALAKAMAQFGDDRSLLATTSREATRFVRNERGLEQAAKAMSAGLAQAIVFHASSSRNEPIRRSVPAT